MELTVQLVSIVCNNLYNYSNYTVTMHVSLQILTSVVIDSRVKTMQPVSALDLTCTSVCVQRNMKERTAHFQNLMNVIQTHVRMARYVM